MVQVFFLVGYCRFVSLDLFPSFLPSPSINTTPDNKSLVISFSIQGMDSTRNVSESTLSLRVRLFGTRRLPPIFSPLDLYTKVGMYLCFFTLSSMILKISSHSNFERPISLHCVTRRSAFCTVLTRVSKPVSNPIILREKRLAMFTWLASPQELPRFSSNANHSWNETTDCNDAVRSYF